MTQPVLFDKDNKESPFLTFVAKEFQQRGTELRKELANKEHAARIVRRFGLSVPKKYKVFSNFSLVNLFWLKKRCVLKYAKGWSARGVMLLERISWKRYFDYMSLRVFSLHELRDHQLKVAESFNAKEPSWIIEEFVEPSQAYGAIPFDYKCYVFGQQIGLVVQIDRNSSPPRVALLDGGFRPLEEGKDYILAGKGAQPGVPSVPRYAPEIQWWAMKLSSMTDSPFVSIDMYDSSTGPVFGEFTFSPGGTHKRMFKFSHELIEHFDALFAAAEKHLEEGWRGKGNYPKTELTDYLAKLRACSIEEIRARKDLPVETYKVCSGVAYNAGSRGALRLYEGYKALMEEDTTRRSFISRWLARTWMTIRDRLNEQHSNRLQELDDEQ